MGLNIFIGFISFCIGIALGLNTKTPKEKRERAELEQLRESKKQSSQIELDSISKLRKERDELLKGFIN